MRSGGVQLGDSTEIVRELFEQHADAIYRFAKYSLPPTIDAKDVVQEVFVRALRNWGDFEGKSDPKTWLFRIAQNYIYDLLRKKRRWQVYESKINTKQQFVQLDTTIELEETLQKLSLPYRQILNLRLIQDMSVTEAAQILDWSESKVRLTFHRAKKKLRNLLQASDEEVWDVQANGGGTANGK